MLVGRARRLRSFMTQPFFTAEGKTGLPGKSVPPEQTVEGAAAILAGRCDDLPEERLFMIGELADAESHA